MKRNVITILLSMLCLAVIAQNVVDKNNMKQGKWVKFDDDGNKVYEGTFKDDKPVGEFLRFFENGKLRSRQIFNADNTVETELFRPEGKLLAKGIFVGTKKEGEWIYYSTKGEVFFREFFKDGKRHGTSTLYDEKGRIFETIDWENGNMHGVRRQFFPDGKLQSEVRYEAGMREGLSQSFFDNGKIEATGSFVNNKKEGIWTFNKMDGSLDFEIEYKNGEPVNKEELDRRLQQQLDENDRNAGMRDPANYMSRPEEFIYE